VRWDGDHKREPLLAGVLARHVVWVPVCPEVELGLGVPREPIRLEGDPRAPRLVGVTTRADHTAAMRRLARARVAALAAGGVAGWVLKEGSPSCGMAGVRVHRRRGGVTRGAGLFARALADGQSLLPAEEEGRLRDPWVRAAFVERVLAYARWQRATAAGMTRRRLAAFHAAHGLLLHAHDPAACRRLAALLRQGARWPLRAVAAAYAAGLMEALRRPATRARHARVLEAILAGVARRLPPVERRRAAAAIRRYRAGRGPLGAPLRRLRRHVARVGGPGLRARAYLAAHPLREAAGWDALTGCR
jgi:uncharacterized protein YbbK (DUF523 family)/uncharacterized protein YbgA (DUF1722 family)